MSLHWSTDPLLYDEQPIKYNNWETANTLIEQKGLAAVVQSDHSLTNLYGILVRKIDFVRSTSRDRIIARFPFLIIDTLLKEKLLPHLLSLAEVVHHYFYKSIDKSILTWKKVISEYLEKGVLPLPVFRCAQEVLPNLSFPIVNDSLHLQSARGEAFTFPTKLTSKLAYLCGICNGDGNLRDYWIIVADETKEHIEFISKLFVEMFSKEGALMKTGGAWIVKLNLLWGVRLFNFLTEQSIDESKYDSLREPVIFQSISDDCYRKEYWKGIMDSDGSYSKYNICLTTSSKQLMKDFSVFLTDYTINHTTREAYYEEMNAYGYIVQILAQSHIAFGELLGSSYQKKEDNLLKIVQRKKAQQEKGLILNIKEAYLTDSGYYDYTKISNLRIFLTKKLSSELYDKINYSKLKENQSTHNRYKNGTLAIPLRLVITLLKKQKKSIALTNYLLTNAIINFSLGKSSAKLPIKPTNEITNLLPYIKIRKDYLQIDLIENSSNYTLLELSSHLVELFQVKLNEVKIHNKVLYTFFTTFYNYNDF